MWDCESRIYTLMRVPLRAPFRMRATAISMNPSFHRGLASFFLYKVTGIVSGSNETGRVLQPSRAE